jgi:hypothetical protein
LVTETRNKKRDQRSDDPGASYLVHGEVMSRMYDDGGSLTTRLRLRALADALDH